MIEYLNKFVEFLKNRMNAFVFIGLVIVLIGLLNFGAFIQTDVIAIGSIMVRLSLAGYIGYWLHKTLFKDFRPALALLPTEQGNTYQISRALVVGAALIAAGSTI